MRLKTFQVVKQLKCKRVVFAALVLTLLGLGLGCNNKNSLSFEVNEDSISVAVKGNSIEVYRNDERISHFEFYSDQYVITSFQGEKEIVIQCSEENENPAMSWILRGSDQISIIDYDHHGQIISEETIEK